MRDVFADLETVTRHARDTLGVVQRQAAHLPRRASSARRRHRPRRLPLALWL